MANIASALFSYPPLPLVIILSLASTCSGTRSINKTLGGRYLSRPLWIDVSISFSVGFALGTVILLLWRITFKHCLKYESSEEACSNPTLFSPIIRSIQDLLFLKADVLPPLEIIGRGGCGEVYKAELLTGGQRITVAIKKILQPAMIDAAHLIEEESKLLGHRMRQIRSEIMTVGRMRHRSLLRLLGHVPKQECHYLVYEYMPNGSLHDVLKRKAPFLSWPARVKIAQQVAAGLEYLHMVHHQKIIHRDLKPANILLDDDLNAKIGDFGLAKIVPDTISGSTLSKNVAGTLGYIAPEYYQTLSCTDKSDIFSFGVILAVLVTGMFPTDGFFQTTDEMSMVGWVRRMVSSEDPSEAIDQTLLGTGFEMEMLLVLKIACFCTYDDPTVRPNSRDVRCMLAQMVVD
ncbi:leucine-rich repeat receptor-like serine/threonine/tyrosine-protein kinase SOBIR1 [Iris pallida]|uniref:Leucine-rich repeat receptor-like serine/threonine/tyrosine-protein kinase SOBIR1 n=1 Tax=Iris pallida TaxID=29817 RepID=A0AAX6FXZ2_IRIPA|nr:leucine-rich repeat receptor-like serine/threonine/tyrosine-protein kinase SOBIR1 [Iris pallida]